MDPAEVPGVLQKLALHNKALSEQVTQLSQLVQQLSAELNDAKASQQAVVDAVASEQQTIRQRLLEQGMSADEVKATKFLFNFVELKNLNESHFQAVQDWITTGTVKGVHAPMNPESVRLSSASVPGRGLLHAAAAGKGPEEMRCRLLRLLVQDGAIPVDSVDLLGRTALHFAAHAHAAEVVRCLLHELGANPSAVDARGTSPLMYAKTKVPSSASEAKVKAQLDTVLLLSQASEVVLHSTQSSIPCTPPRNAATAIGDAAHASSPLPFASPLRHFHGVKSRAAAAASPLPPWRRRSSREASPLKQPSINRVESHVVILAVDADSSWTKPASERAAPKVYTRCLPLIVQSRHKSEVRFETIKATAPQGMTVAASFGPVPGSCPMTQRKCARTLVRAWRQLHMRAANSGTCLADCSSVCERCPQREGTGYCEWSAMRAGAMVVAGEAGELAPPLTPDNAPPLFTPLLPQLTWAELLPPITKKLAKADFKAKRDAVSAGSPGSELEVDVVDTGSPSPPPRRKVQEVGRKKRALPEQGRPTPEVEESSGGGAADGGGRVGAGEGVEDGESGDVAEEGAEGGEAGDGAEEGAEGGEAGDVAEEGAEGGEAGDGAEEGVEGGEAGDVAEEGVEGGEAGDVAEEGVEGGEAGDVAEEGAEGGDSGDVAEEGAEGGEAGDGAEEGVEGGDSGDVAEEGVEGWESAAGADEGVDGWDGEGADSAVPSSHMADVSEPVAQELARLEGGSPVPASATSRADFSTETRRIGTGSVETKAAALAGEQGGPSPAASASPPADGSSPETVRETFSQPASQAMASAGDLWGSGAQVGVDTQGKLSAASFFDSVPTDPRLPSEQEGFPSSAWSQFDDAGWDGPQGGWGDDDMQFPSTDVAASQPAVGGKPAEHAQGQAAAIFANAPKPVLSAKKAD